MGTRNIRLLGFFFVVFAMLCSGRTINAQNTFTQTDSVTLTWDSVRTTLRDFDTVAVGNTECHTIYFKNTGTSPVIINKVFGFDGQGAFTSKTIPTLPVILLQNEIVSLAEFCFAPINGTSSVVVGALAITGMIGSSAFSIDARAKGFQKPDTLISKPFITLKMDGDFFGPIIMDGDASHTATLTSNRKETIQVRMDSDIYNGNGYFHVSGITFPYNMSAQEVKNFTITYSPRSNVAAVSYRSVGMLSLQASDNTESDYLKLTLPGVAILPTATDSSTALAAGSTDILAMISDNSVTTQTFHFKNTGSTNLKITGVDLKNKKSFAITDIQPTTTLPFILTPGQSMAVTVAMTTVSNGVYYDEVIITAENAFISMNFPLQGLRKNGLAAVHDVPSASSLIMLYPNPSHGSISVEMPGIENAKIQVLDLLGRVITSAVASQKWTWNSAEPAGTYILHLTGNDDSGKTFQSYDRFIIKK